MEAVVLKSRLIAATAKIGVQLERVQSCAKTLHVASGCRIEEHEILLDHLEKETGHRPAAIIPPITFNWNGQRVYREGNFFLGLVAENRAPEPLMSNIRKLLLTEWWEDVIKSDRYSVCLPNFYAVGQKLLFIGNRRTGEQTLGYQLQGWRTSGSGYQEVMLPNGTLRVAQCSITPIETEDECSLTKEN